MKNTQFLQFLLISILLLFTEISGSLTSGLLAKYQFNGNANDESTNGRHGTIVGDVSLTTDRFVSLTTDRFGVVNHAYRFVQTSTHKDYILFEPTIYNTWSDLSVSFWIFAAPTGLSKRTQLIKTDSYQVYCSSVTGSRVDLALKLNDASIGSTTISFPVTLSSTGDWHHIVLTKGGGSTSNTNSST
jgi:hypothetical protein